MFALIRSMEIFGRAGVSLVWWFHSKQRTVRVCRYGQSVAELREADELDGEDMLPGFRLAVSEILAQDPAQSTPR